MADELNIPIHRWYEPRNNISLPNSDFSKQWIYDSGIQKIDRWINSQPWGNPIPGLFSSTAIGIWLDPSDVANLSWRRNLLTYSEQFDNAAWVKVGVTVPSTTSTAPDGTATADKAVATNTASSTRALYQNFTAPSTTTYTLTVYAKAAEYSLLALQEIGGGRFGASFDLTANSSASLGGAGYVTSSITPVGNSWFRCAVVWTGVAAAGYAITTIGYPTGVTPSSAGTSYAGDGTSGILIWGAQLELGTVATDYQRISDVNTEVIERFPTATMYQDAAGTTPVTTPGQPVGLRLDKSKGLVLGAELVANGDFSGGTTGWSVTGGTQAVVSGALVVTPSPSVVVYSSQSFSTVIGRTYQVRGSILAGTSTFFGIRKGDGATGGANAVTLRSSVGELVGVFTATATTSFIIMQANDSGSATFDNISVRELPGNHATQSVLASRPVYGIEPAGGRRNLLTYTEDLTTVGGWSLASATSVGGATDPDSGATAFTLTATANNANILRASNLNTIGIQYINSFYIRRVSGSGTVSLYRDTGAETVITLTSSWARYSVTWTATGVNGYIGVKLAVSGDVVQIWHPQQETGSTATAYQRVSSAFDVTEAGVQSCHYVQYDGSDDGMITNSIDFTATDKMSVFAGVRKSSDTNPYSMVLELSSASSLNNGAFALMAPYAGPNYGFDSKGTVATTAASASTFPAPINNLLTGLGDISGDRATLRVNGVQAAQSTGDQGTGNYGNYRLNLGRRGNDQATPTLPFSGRDYGIVVVGKATTADEITSTERWLSGKTGFYAPIITGVPTIGVS